MSGEGVKRLCAEPENGRPGDWLCPGCGHHNWSFRDVCQKCFTNKDGVKTTQAPQKPGDWNCPGCGHLNYSFRNTCQRCHTPNASANGAGAGGGRPGDWNCPTCGDLVYATRFACRKCNTPKPQAGGAMGGAMGAGYVTHQTGYGMPGMDPMAAMYGLPQMPAAMPPMPGQKVGSVPKEARPGDWTCPKCFDIVYATRNACRLCNTPKPIPDPTGFSAMYGYGDLSGYGDMSAYGGFSMGQVGGAAPAGHTPGRRPGDWDCPNCGDVCYATRSECRKCKTSKPEHLAGAAPAPFRAPMNGGLGPSRRAGDWDCPQCGDVQYASRTECRKCRTPKPEI